MKMLNISKAKPRAIVMVAITLLFLSILLDIARSAPNRQAAPRPTAAVTPETFSKPALVRDYQQTITPEALAAHIYLLASDSLEGRETGTRGQKLAAQYLAAQYRSMGLAPKGSAGRAADARSPEAYFQPFTLYRRTPVETRLEVVANGQKVASSTFSAQAHDDMSYFLTGDTVGASGDVVFAGYGISDTTLGYDDYAALKEKGISIDGKWLMILADEPQADAATSLLPSEGHKSTKWSASIMPKRKVALEYGQPAGVLIVRHAGPRMQGTFEDAAAQASLAAARIGYLSLNKSPFPPTHVISAGLADKILASSGRTVEELRRQIDKGLKPDVFDVKGVRVNTTVEQSKGIETENVLAFIEGSDPRLKDEVLVISSHYDHLGLNPALKGDQIFNGAADDASGVAATLELARAFMRAKREGQGPRRSILFINFSAEEKGTLGSAHYALKEPLVPLEKTVVDINMDGVGGFDLKHPNKSRNYIYMVGTEELSKELLETNKRVNEVTSVGLELTASRNYGSDHEYFRAQLVPFIYYTTGLTEHYHTPADEAATIDYEHLSKVTRLVFGTAWQLANQEARPRSVDRSRLKIEGYVCPPCPFECDTKVYAHSGECPVCGMHLVPKYSGPGI